MVSLLTAALEFLAVLIAAFKGISAGDRWINLFVEALKENTNELKKYNESKSKNTDD